MLKVIIVDDEYWISHGLSTMIDWTSLGLKVICTANDALTAIEACRQDAPDIIVTDINMPGMDGLEMIEKLSGICPQAKIIIISGYDDFSYAQKAIRLNVLEYILKPIDIPLFTSTIEKVRDKIAEERRAVQDNDQLKNFAEMSRSIVLKWTMAYIIHGQLTENTISFQQSELLENYRGKPCCVVRISVDDYILLSEKNSPEKMESLIIFVNSAVEKEFEKDAVILARDEGEFTVCIFADKIDDRSKWYAAVKKRIDAIRVRLAENGTRITAAIGTVSGNIFAARNSYSEAQKALRHSFVYGKGKTYIYALSEKLSADEPCADSIQYEAIAGKVLYERCEGVDDILDGIKNMLYQKTDESRFYLQSIVQNIFIAINNEIAAIPSAEKGRGFSPIEATRAIVSSDTLDSAFELLRQKLLEISALANVKCDETAMQIRKAMTYIEDKYSDRELRLDSIARAANMSVSHFCIKFKQETGKTCMEYLSDVRIEKAKQLLSTTPVKIGCISDMVGYNNYTYFSTLFKKRTGYSPDAYRSLPSDSGDKSNK